MLNYCHFYFKFVLLQYFFCLVFFIEERTERRQLPESQSKLLSRNMQRLCRQKLVGCDIFSELVSLCQY